MSKTIADQCRTMDDERLVILFEEKLAGAQSRIADADLGGEFSARHITYRKGKGYLAAICRERTIPDTSHEGRMLLAANRLIGSAKIILEEIRKREDLVERKRMTNPPPRKPVVFQEFLPLEPQGASPRQTVSTSTPP